jgi:hypothetical protein
LKPINKRQNLDEFIKKTLILCQKPPFLRPVNVKMNNIDFEKAVAEFVGAFEIVFRYDWQYTKEMIGDEEEGAFVEPELEDEIDNWGARGDLLEKYRQLIIVMQEQGIEPSFHANWLAKIKNHRVW